MNSLYAIAAVIGLARASSPAQPQDTVRVNVGQGSEVWIEGSSNVADWRCRAAAFDARVALAPDSTAGSEGPATAIRAINVRVPVRDLKCGNRKMEHDLYAALGATDPAKASFIVGRFDVIGDSGPAAFATRGLLTVAGMDREVTVPVTVDRGGDGLMRARGTVAMRMTDFGIKPPVGLFGLIRSRNEVTVKFALVIPPQTIAWNPP